MSEARKVEIRLKLEKLVLGLIEGTLGGFAYCFTTGGADETNRLYDFLSPLTKELAAKYHIEHTLTKGQLGVQVRMERPPAEEEKEDSSGWTDRGFIQPLNSRTFKKPEQLGVIPMEPTPGACGCDDCRGVTCRGNDCDACDL